jgi:hypothetical protein
VLAGGLHRPQCDGQTFMRRLERRFARAQHGVDQAEDATGTIKARRRLRKVARLLEKSAEGVGRLGNGGKISADCASAIEAMLADGKRRAVELALTL